MQYQNRQDCMNDELQKLQRKVREYGQKNQDHQIDYKYILQTYILINDIIDIKHQAIQIIYEKQKQIQTLKQHYQYPMKITLSLQQQNQQLTEKYSQLLKSYAQKQNILLQTISFYEQMQADYKDRLQEYVLKQNINNQRLQYYESIQSKYQCKLSQLSQQLLNQPIISSLQLQKQKTIFEQNILSSQNKIEEQTKNQIQKDKIKWKCEYCKLEDLKIIGQRNEVSKDQLQLKYCPLIQFQFQNTLKQHKSDRSMFQTNKIRTKQKKVVYENLKQSILEYQCHRQDSISNFSVKYFYYNSLYKEQPTLQQTNQPPQQNTIIDKVAFVISGFLFGYAFNQ